MKKRILGLLLALCLIVGMLPIAVFAESPEVSFSFRETTGITDVTMNAGDAAKYYVTEKEETSGNYYFKSTTDTANWNVKFEYATDGIPTVTLKNATIKNDTPLHFGKSDAVSASPVKVVLEGDNKVTGNASGVSPLHFYTTGDVTFTGSGKLAIVSDRNGKQSGVIHSTGNIIFDNTNVSVTLLTGSGCAHAIAALGGDITVKGGNITIDGSNTTGTHNITIYAAFYATKNTAGTAGGNLTIQDGANVKVVASPANSGTIASTVEIAGTFTINESTVEIAIVGTTYYKVFDARPTTNLVFANGCTVTATSNKFNGAAQPTFVTAENGDITITAPAVTETYNSIDAIPESEDTDENHIVRLWYLKVAANAPAGGSTPEGGNPGGSTPEGGNPGGSTPEGGNPGGSTPEGGNPGGGTTIDPNKPEAKFDFITSGDAVPSDEDAELVMKAGEATKYYVTKQADTNNPDNWYMIPSTEANWNVKIEYPVNGIPTVTMKNAKIINLCGFFIGGYNIKCETDVKIVLEGDNYIKGGQYRGPLTSRSSGTVTITGSGKLELVSNCNAQSQAVLFAEGNMILDNTNITITMPEEWGKTNGIGTLGGDITVKGGNLTIIGYDDPATLHKEGAESGYYRNQNAIYSAVFVQKNAAGTAGGNFTVQDGAKVFIVSSTLLMDNKKNNHATVYTDGKFTIKDSTVEIGMAGTIKSGAVLFLAKPTLEFANNAYTVTLIKTKQPTYKNGALSFDAAKAVDYAAATSMSSMTYFKVVPGGTGGSTTGGSTSNPNTGDISVLLTAGLALASAVGMGGVTILRKKNG